MTAALGITTYNRPQFAEKCGRAIEAQLADTLDGVYLYNDGSDPKHRGAYERAYAPLRRFGATIMDATDNHGVAYAKNRLLERMLEETSADWLFLIEDDIKVLHPRAITQYVRVAETSGLHHLSFAHHGPGNVEGPVATDGRVEYYRHSIGAFTMFSRESLLAVGLLDERLRNAWEHVEHELRLIVGGWMPGCGPHRYPDVAGSRQWLQEFPNSIEKSSIRPRPDWAANIAEGLAYWRTAKPETYNLLFGPGTALEAYARSVIG